MLEPVGLWNPWPRWGRRVKEIPNLLSLLPREGKTFICFTIGDEPIVPSQTSVQRMLLGRSLLQIERAFVAPRLGVCRAAQANYRDARTPP